MASVFDPLRWAAVALDVLVSGHATPDALATRQQTRLARLLEVALRRSPLYGQRLERRFL